MKLRPARRMMRPIPVLMSMDLPFFTRSSSPADVMRRYPAHMSMNTAIGAAIYITRANRVPPTLGIYAAKSPTATRVHQSWTNPRNMRPMIPYMIRFLACFLFSSSPPDTSRLKSPHVNIVTATPNANTRRNAIILPKIPSNPAVFQNILDPVVLDQLSTVPIDPRLLGANIV